MDRKGQGRRALFWVLVGIGCLLVVLPTASIGAVADVGAAGTALQEDAESDRLDDADEIQIDVYVHENGSATFYVDYRFESNNDSDWERLREDVEANPDAYAERQRDRWSDVVAEGENETEREMEIDDVTVSTAESSAPVDMGHVRVAFTWDSFAYPELNRIEAGAALAGLSLPQNTWLQVYAPPGYTIDEVSPEPAGWDGESGGNQSSDDELASVRWGDSGDPFVSTPPSIVMIEESDGGGGGGGGGSGGGGGEGTNESDAVADPVTPWPIVLVALALLASVGAAGWWLQRDRDGREVASATNGGTAPDGSTAAPERERPPPELLSNEERVLRLLEERGGRIKQQEVVSELDWTEAKTSQVVSGLREDDEIDVFRIGRENVLALPEEEDEE